MKYDLGFHKRVGNKWSSLLHSAEKRGLEFNLTHADVVKLLKQRKCAYTGRILLDAQYEGNTPDDQRTVERLDNNRGYVQGNVVCVTHRMNQLRADLTREEVQGMLQAWDKHNV